MLFVIFSALYFIFYTQVSELQAINSKHGGAENSC